MTHVVGTDEMNILLKINSERNVSDEKSLCITWQGGTACIKG